MAVRVQGCRDRVMKGVQSAYYGYYYSQTTKLYLSYVDELKGVCALSQVTWVAWT